MTDHPDDQRPDCRTCVAYVHLASHCAYPFIGGARCANGDRYIKADPVRLYETGEA